MALKPKEHFHGSDLEKIEAVYGIKKEDIISFSANVNPLGVSFRLKETLTNHIDAITTYPDREYTSLRKCIADYVHTNYENIVVGNGSTELISLFIQITHPMKALIVGPTYSEYEREVAMGGGRSHYFSLTEASEFELDTKALTEELSANVDLLILCNPNNPTSSVIKRQQMREILDYCKRKSITVLVDETYVEFAPCIEEITAIPLTKRYDNLMVIRGVSKFYAAPGLRFGYGITSSEAFLKSLHQHQNPWSLNSVGAYTGELLLKDADYFRETRALILSERARMFARLSHMDGYKPYAAYGNFILVRILKGGLTSFDVFEAAIKNRLMIRDCSSFESLTGEYIRFCIMNPEDNDRLLHVLNSLI